MVGSIRSFVAFDMDNEAVLSRITRVQSLLVKTGADLKSVDPKNIHITVRFLGDIAPNAVDKIHEEMKKTQFTAFNVRVHGVGAFPNVHNPRVVWAGITDGADQLRSIFEQLEPRLHELGFAPEPKGFNAHLTIARVRSGSNKDALAKCIRENADVDFGVVRATCLRLKSSDLTSHGPIYATLREYCP